MSMFMPMEQLLKRDNYVAIAQTSPFVSLWLWQGVFFSFHWNVVFNILGMFKFFAKFS